MIAGADNTCDLFGGWEAHRRGYDMFGGWFPPLCCGVRDREARAVGTDRFEVRWESWAGDPAAVRVFSDGELLATTKQSSWAVHVPAGQNAEYTILDDPQAVPRANPSRARLQVYLDDERVDHLEVVEESADGDPVVGRVRNAGPGYYSHTTRQLEDGDTHEFSVRARRLDADDAGNTKLARSFPIHRSPDMPFADLSYVGAGKFYFLVTG